MGDRRAELLAILRIGHETSVRGSGLSLRQALERRRYAELRPGFDADDLLSLIQADDELVDQWVLYSEDKRTRGGWYVLRDGTMGQLSDWQADLRFESVEEAVAEYVVRELDFWAGRDKAGQQAAAPDRRPEDGPQWW